VGSLSDRGRKGTEWRGRDAGDDKGKLLVVRDAGVPEKREAFPPRARSCKRKRGFRGKHFRNKKDQCPKRRTLMIGKGRPIREKAGCVRGG